MRTLAIHALEGMPGIRPGTDLADEILGAAARNGLRLADGDIVVIAQKIVSKAEGRSVRLEAIVPGAAAQALAHTTGKDPRLAELVLGESAAVLRARRNVVVVEHRLGHVMANAGVDRSNLDAAPDDEAVVLLLPEDPDRSAAALRDRLRAATGVRLGVVISDSFGRAWRLGTVGVALGLAGPPAVIDRRGEADLYGRPLQVTEIGFADAVAAAAVLVMGEGAEGCPVAVVRGQSWSESRQTARDGLRPRSEDMFR
ncbi:coenzyme F420-0:L-glutamate ligase [Aquabacter spiritensis]|uniref:Coenzyme F420-0 gamma-glutamyl ligase n=1 Tax=Aquabacter spiritensis TaxID=933073 RepID=A0A4R3LWJ0_9HYPH|nr:coenzyme F420-0:L-glutamate ligase [Aquabacter spiritensis]TCT05001.1 coenzyme F420-0 gamma-glutamyl ligase [Aquabacter spiritensis]